MGKKSKRPGRAAKREERKNNPAPTPTPTQASEVAAQASDNAETQVLERRANVGGPDTQFALGCMYYQGNGVDQDYPEALTCFKEAANLGHAKAMSNLGVMYKMGRVLIKTTHKL